MHVYFDIIYVTSKDMKRLILADGWVSGFPQAIQTPNEKR